VHPAISLFRPVLEPGQEAGEVLMTLDEFEAIRLADSERLHQQEAAARMNVSRPTFGRILDAAHGKIAAALIRGESLRIEGGPICTGERQRLYCQSCMTGLAGGTGKAMSCWKCRDGTAESGGDPTAGALPQRCQNRQCWRDGKMSNRQADKE
jgi:uncharacterized protein